MEIVTGGRAMEIVTDDLTGPEIAAFLQAHVDQMRALTPLESKHALDLDGLRDPSVTFWSVRDGATVAGCGAIKVLETGHAELKSMRTDPSRARGGIASALLRHILAESREMGIHRISLETGSADFFRPARRLYEKFAFTYCPPFASYVEDPNSVYMTREL